MTTPMAPRWNRDPAASGVRWRAFDAGWVITAYEDGRWYVDGPSPRPTHPTQASGQLDPTKHKDLPEATRRVALRVFFVLRGALDLGEVV